MKFRFLAVLLMVAVVLAGIAPILGAVSGGQGEDIVEGYVAEIATNAVGDGSAATLVVIPTFPSTSTFIPPQTETPTLEPATETATPAPVYTLISAFNFGGGLSEMAQLLFRLAYGLRQDGVCSTADLILVPVGEVPVGVNYLKGDTKGEYAIHSVYMCGDNTSPHMLQVYPRKNNWEDAKGKYIPFTRWATSEYALTLYQYRYSFNYSGWLLDTPAQERLALWHFCQGASPEAPLSYAEWAYDPDLARAGTHFPTYGVSINPQVQNWIFEQHVYYEGWIGDAAKYTHCMPYLQ